MLSILSAGHVSALYSLPYPHFIEMEAEAETGKRAEQGHTVHTGAWTQVQVCLTLKPMALTSTLPASLSHWVVPFLSCQVSAGRRREGGKPASPQQNVLLPAISFLYPGDT